MNGGIGVIHNNLSIKEQVDEVTKVKRFENGFILNPFVLSPLDTLETIDEIKKQHGFSGFPVTENGQLGAKLVGIVTKRDVDFIEDRKTLVSKVMTEHLVTMKRGSPISEAYRVLVQTKKGKVRRLTTDKK